jgi:hypothetical protein
MCHRNQTAMRRVQRPNQLGAEQQRAREGNRLTKRSGVALTKFISGGVENRAVRWTIGCKPSANSKAQCCHARKPSRGRS